MYLTVRGVVLRVTDYNDRDALLTLHTQNYGKLTAKARGLRRKNSPLTAPCQLLAFGEFVLFEYRGQYTINEAHSIELFPRLRRELTKLSLGSYFAQVVDLISQEDTPSPELQSLLLNCLYALANLDIPELVVKAVFELRCACIAGFQPDLFGCHRCGNQQPDRFDLSGGHLECKDCQDGAHSGIRLPVTPTMLDAMRYICLCDPKKMFSFRISKEAEAQLSALTEAYLATQLERGFSALDFYKSLWQEPQANHT